MLFIMGIVIVVNLKAQTATPPALGDGTSADPYQISTLDNLYWLSQTPGVWVSGTFFIQTADIDAAATTGWDSGKGFNPIGPSLSITFDATYDGNDKTISNLFINRPATAYVGLFGYSYGKIKNLRLVAANVTGGQGTGTIAGASMSRISNCHASGTVSGLGSTGGLVGQLSGNLSASSADVTVRFSSSGYQSIGGLVGEFVGGDMRITNCFALGNVDGHLGNNYIGGLVGNMATTNSIENCYSVGQVIGGTSTTQGGLVGYNQGTVINSFWDTETSLQANSAGGAGKTTTEMHTQSTFTDTAWNFDIFWAITASNYPIINLRLPTFGGGMGTAESPFQIANLNQLVLLSQFWDQWDKSFIQTANIDASATMPSAQSVVLNPIGDSFTAFAGTYDGQNFTIDKLYQNLVDFSVPTGLFGITFGTTLKNIHLTNVQISGDYFIGGLVGEAISSDFSNCHVEGEVNAVLVSGGFVGYSEGSTFANCSAYVAMTGSDSYGTEMMTHLGGFAGTVQTNSSFTDCYARGSVSGYQVGGFIGGVDFSSSGFGDPAAIDFTMGFTLTNCYAANILTGTLGNGGLYGQDGYTFTGITITNSFWDKDLAGTTNGFIGGTGMTTTDMKTKSTFTDAVWDFANVPVWRINGLFNNGYPYLTMEHSLNTWDGTADSKWNNPGNWSNSSVPIALEDITIPLKTNNPIVDELSATPAVCKNLTIDAGAVLTINAGKALTVNGNLVNNADVTGLKILSDFTNGTGSLKILGSTSAPATVQRYMSIDKWHMLSAPAIGKIADFIDLNTDIPVIGVPVTDPITPATYGMMDYNTPGIKWNPYFTKAIVGTSDLGIGKGYLVRTIADQGLTITFKGSINAGPVNVVASEGWNCIGNPYPSGININTLAGTESGGDNFIDINLGNLDPNSTGAYIWNDVDKKYDITNLAGGISYAQVGQGFFMKVAAGKASVSFTPQMQVHQGTAAYKSAIAPYPTIKLIATNNATVSSTDIKFIDGTTRGLDVGYDAGIFKSEQPLNLCTKLVEDNGIEFQLQCLPTDQYNTLVVPIGLDSKAGGEIVFSVQTVQLDPTCKVILEDNLTNTFTDLSKNSYKTTVEANTAGTGRFFLHTGDIISGLEDQVLQGRLTAYVKGNTEIHVFGDLGDGAIATLFNGLGQVVLTKKLESGNLNIIGLPNLSSGVYLLNVNDKGTPQTIKIMVRK